MEKTSNKNGLKIVLCFIVAVALVVGLLLGFSSCSGDEENGASAAVPEVKDATDDKGGDVEQGATAATPAAPGNAGTGGQPSTSGSTGANAGTGSTGTGDQASLEDWINYFKDYDDNVESGVKDATKDFTDVIDNVGNSMSNGNYGDGVQQFADGLEDYLGGIAGSLRP